MEPYVSTLLTLLITMNMSLLESSPITNLNSSQNPFDAGNGLSGTDKGLLYRTSTVVKSCTLFATDKQVAGEIKGHLTSGVNLLKFYVEFQSSEILINKDNTSLVYRPLYWVRSPSQVGNGLLLLRPEYDVLSLMTLELRIVTMHIQVEMHPSNCLNSLNVNDVEKVLRALVMVNFQNSSSGDIDVDTPTDQVCNIHATDSLGVVNFRYLCCHSNEPGYIYCKYLESDTWLDILFALITLVKILVILFSPMFVPDRLYRLRHQPVPYKHKCLDNKFVLNTIKTNSPEKFMPETVKNRYHLSDFRAMEQFSYCLENMGSETMYRLTLNHIKITVAEDRLLSAEQAPVGIVNTLYESFVKCEISERGALAEFCQSDVLNISSCKRQYSFYNCCRQLMKFTILFLLAVPWILRVIAYYEFEHDEITRRKEAASQRGLKFYFPGNLILWLTPVHLVFIATYIILSLEVCLFGVFGRFGTKTSEKLRFVILKCFRDMREMDHTKVVGWAVKLLLRPCVHFGLIGFLFGLIIWPVVLPLIFLVWAFHVFPTVNITLRLLYNLAIFLFPCSGPSQFCRLIRKYLTLKLIDFPESSSIKAMEIEKDILMSPAKRFYQLIIIISCLFTMYSIILLIFEFVSFLAEIVVYTMMGLILNAGTILTYLSLLLLLGLYGNDCFGNVTNTFMAFNKKMNQIVLSLAYGKVENVVYTKEDKQDNISFGVKTDQCSELDCQMQLTKGADGKPCLEIARLLLFVDKSDEPFIPRGFYFKACKMDYYAVPGDVLVRYLRAGLEFGVILLFLFFVLLVVFAFGDRFEISSSNKLLATVLGGFVPLLLRKVVFKPRSVPDIDQSSVHFQIPLTDLIDPYQETWPIFDIHVEPANIEPIADFDGEINLLIDTRAKHTDEPI